MELAVCISYLLDLPGVICPFSCPYRVCFPPLQEICLAVESLQPHPTLTQSLLMIVILLLMKLMPLFRLTSMKTSLNIERAHSEHQPKLIQFLLLP